MMEWNLTIEVGDRPCENFRLTKSWKSIGRAVASVVPRAVKNGRMCFSNA